MAINDILIGYVSNEEYSALPGVYLEFVKDGRIVHATRSTASGAVLGDLAAGAYRVTLAKPGYGSKRVEMSVDPERPYAFRLLSDRLAGFVWPKWARSGERGEFRVHSVEPYHLSLCRYGLEKELVQAIGWFDAHGPRAVIQITPDGDYTRAGVGWNRVGWGSPHQRSRRRAGAFRAILLPRARRVRGVLLVSVGRRADAASSQDCGAGFDEHLERVQLLRRPEQLRQRLRPCRHADSQFAAGPEAVRRRRLRRVAGAGRGVCAALLRAAGAAAATFPNMQPSPTPLRAATPATWRRPNGARWRGWSAKASATIFIRRRSFTPASSTSTPTAVVLLTSIPNTGRARCSAGSKSWVHERGGRLIYLGGNGLNCEVEFRTRHDGHALRSRLPGTGGAMTGRHGRVFESRFPPHLESEASLLGVAFTQPGIMTAAPYRVVDAAHWAFAGTGLRDGEIFGRGHAAMSAFPAAPPATRPTSARPPRRRERRCWREGLNPDEGGAEMVLLRDSQRRRRLLRRLHNLPGRPADRRSNLAYHA